MTHLTADELSLLRDNHPHSAEIYLSVVVPPVVYCGAVSGSPTRGDRTITSSTSIEGNISNVLAGQTVLVGSAGCGSYDVGKVRLKSRSGNTITVAENDIDWTLATHITVVETWELYPIMPRIDDDLVFYKDYDIVYSDQNEEPTPVAIAGPPRVGMIASAGGSVTFPLDATDSYAIADDATIVSYLWQCTGGSIASASSSVTTLIVSVAGQYWLSLTVADSNGKTQTTRRPVIVHDSDHMPYRDFQLESPVHGDWDTGGWSVRISVSGSADELEFPNGAMIVLWHNAFYGSVEQFVGGVYTQNILFAGYILADRLEDSWSGGAVVFDAYTIHELLRRTFMFSVSLEYNTSPSAWYQYADLTVARALHHLWRWHSTLFDIADVFLPVDNTLLMYACDEFTESDLYTQADALSNRAGIHAHIACTKHGQIFVEQDVQMLDDAARAAIPVILDIQSDDWVDARIISHEQVEAVGKAVLSGISFDGTVSTPLISEAPSVPAGGSSTVYAERQVLESQTDSNERCGRLLALNNVRYELQLDMAGNYAAAFDIVSQEWCTVSMVASDTARKLEWSSKKFVARTIDITIDIAGGHIHPKIVFQEEAQGQDGVTSEYPTSPPYDYDYPDPIPPVPVPTPADDTTGGNTVIVQVEDAIGITSDFVDSSPTYRRLPIPSGCGTIHRLIIDPYVVSESGRTSVWIACQNGVWMVEDILTLPVWLQRLSATQFASATGKTLSAVRNIQGTICQQDRFYAQCLATDGSLYICTTSDGGGSWTTTYIGVVTDTAVPIAFDVSRHNADVVWSGGADGVIYRSVDGGATFSTLYTVSDNVGPVNSIHVPYANNPDDLIVYVGGRATYSYASLDLPCTKDAYIDESHPSTNYGSSFVLFARFGAYDNCRAFLEFEGRKAIGGTITSAVLYMYVTAANPWGKLMKRWRVTSDWDEPAITYNNDPSVYRLSTWQEYIRGSAGWDTYNVKSELSPVGNHYGVALGASGGSQTIQWHSRHVAGYEPYLHLVGSLTLDLPYVMKSIDGGVAFDDITPTTDGDRVGALGFYPLEIATLDGATVYALLSSDTDETAFLFVSTDGHSWTQQADFSAAGGDGQSSIGAWPTNPDVLYALQHKNPGGAPTNMIMYSVDFGKTWLGRHGNWAAVIQAVWGLNSKLSGTIVPVWMP